MFSILFVSLHFVFDKDVFILMKRYLYIIIIISVLFPPLRAFSQVLPSDENLISVDNIVGQYNRNYDSLLNSYYIKKYSRYLVRHNNALTDQEFEKVPDSVISQRIGEIHTVLPLAYNDIVRSYIRMYINRMSTRLDVMLTLCEYYHPMFEEVLARYGVPEELKYLTIVESAMNPMATSRVGAAGLWQFMYTTGKHYDLEVNSIVDDRRDPYKSTVAAARYLSDLHDVFDDWILAIAAYNCGPGNINKAIARSGGKRDYWEIYSFLPHETRGYIPAFIAATYVMTYYPEHGLKPRKITMPIHTDTIVLSSDAYMCYVSQFLDIEMAELRTLNPQYRIDFIPASSGTYTLCLPSDKLPNFFAVEDSIYIHTQDSLNRKPVTKSTAVARAATPKAVYYTVRKGDNLSRIASRNGTTVQSIKRRNGLKSDKIRIGQRLRIK